MGQRQSRDSHDREPTVAPAGSPDWETRRGELEWRIWLEDQGGLDPSRWVTALSKETATLMEAGRVRSALRLLELAVSPASPVFDTLTGPRGKELALRLETSWAVVRRDEYGAGRHASGEEDPVAAKARDAEVADLDLRVRGLAAVLRGWLRYRRHRRHEREAETPAVSRGEIDVGRLEGFYRNWVLVPLRENFLRVLEDRGLTRRGFCARLGMSEAYLSQILNGRRNPSLRKLAEMSFALQVDLGRIFAVRAHRGGEEPWSDANRPEPGDTETWYPGKVNRPYAALEAHYRLLFYPGPDLPGEKILARSFLIVDPVPGELGFEQRYALHDEDETVVVASYMGTAAGGKRQRFMAPDGRTIETAAPGSGAAKSEPRLAGRVAGALVEF
jgi:transcriptional regulator with XRE-family HTH domain